MDFKNVNISILDSHIFNNSAQFGYSIVINSLNSYISIINNKFNDNFPLTATGYDIEVIQSNDNIFF